MIRTSVSYAKQELNLMHGKFLAAKLASAESVLSKFRSRIVSE